MRTDMDSAIAETDGGFRNLETSKERVVANIICSILGDGRRLTQRIIGLSGGIFDCSGPIVPPHALLPFQGSKLREDQIALPERGMRPWIEEEK